MPEHNKHPTAQEAQQQAVEAVATLSDFIERLLYAAFAFFATSILLAQFLGFELHEAAEPAILNAGLAYYSHAATGRLIRAVVAIARPKLAPSKVTIDEGQKVEVEQA